MAVWLPNNICRVVIGWLLLWTTSQTPINADELKLTAEALFARSVTEHLSLTPNRDEIQLQRGVLYEDDGPAAGYSYRSNTEKLDGGVWIRKELIIPSPQAGRATLLVGAGGQLQCRVNGKSVTLDSLGKQGNYWRAYQFPPDVLRPGGNEFVLSGTGSIWIAREDEFAAGSLTRQKHPNRSAKSVDKGQTWDDTRLGTQNNVDGEYYVRVFLDQHQALGKLTLGVIDAGNLAGNVIGPPLTDVGPIRIKADVLPQSRSAITIRARTGSSFVPDKTNWSEWSPVTPVEGVITNPSGRYLQLEISLSTNDPLSTPNLKGLTVSASPRRPTDWTKDVRIVEVDNPRLVRTSIPFQYEPFDRQELKRLRRQYKLDDVVAGAPSEFELMRRLAAWSATRWKRMHLAESYPPYNALEILAPHEDGTPVGGFCQQYNIVFLQACESFGLVGRLVSIGPGNLTDKVRGGHEAVEIWSNEFGKWVYIDGNTAWYAVDKETKGPLSLWQLRDRQLAASRGTKHRPLDVVTLAETKYEWADFMHWARLAELRLIPRSNFLEQQSPLPLNQGMRGWFWTGHYVWTDDQTPARLLYQNRIIKRDNFEWTLNQTHVVLEATNDPGKLRVHFETNTPSLDGVFVTINKQDEQQVMSPFVWSLQSGMNRLNLVPRNTAGRNGVHTYVLVSSPSF